MPARVIKKKKRNTRGYRAHPRRRNGDEDTAAAKLSEDFHGRPAKSAREIEEVRNERDTLADLGKLVSLLVWVDEDRPYELTFTRGVRLAASPDGGQLYFVAGDQALDLQSLGLDQYLPKDHITVGLVESIVYSTSKAFHNFERSDYEHEFGEEGGEQPVLGYDALNRKLYLTGGSYQVKPEGIVN